MRSFLRIHMDYHSVLFQRLPSVSLLPSAKADSHHERDDRAPKASNVLAIQNIFFFNAPAVFLTKDVEFS